MLFINKNISSFRLYAFEVLFEKIVSWMLFCEVIYIKSFYHQSRRASFTVYVNVNFLHVYLKYFAFTKSKGLIAKAIDIKFSIKLKFDVNRRNFIILESFPYKLLDHKMFNFILTSIEQGNKIHLSSNYFVADAED